MKRTLVGLALVLLLSSMAFADNLYLPPLSSWTGPFNILDGSTRTQEYGGTAVGATLNGQTLPWLFCLERTVTVNVPGNYNSTDVNDQGMIHNAPFTGASQIAWLLDTYLSPATMTQNSAATIALQVAIWHVADPNVTADAADSHNYFNLYNNMIAALDGNSGDVTHYDWITPAPGTNQGLITDAPDGGMTLMLLGGALVGLQAVRRKFRV